MADLYRRRWTIETAFAEMEKVLNGEINALGYPKQRCLASVWPWWRTMSCPRSRVGAPVHGETKVEKLSGFYLADEIQMCHRGMMKAIPKDHGVLFQAATTTEFAEVMKVWARSVPLEEIASNPRGPKKPKLKKQSGAKIKHVSFSGS